MLSSKILPALSILLLCGSTLFAQEKQVPQNAFSPNFLIMMVLIFGILYFFMIRPEQKKQKQRLEMLKNIKKGDKVLTAAGIIGVVGNVKNDQIMVKIADNTVVEFTKSAITAVINETNTAADSAAEKSAGKGDKEKK
ncbi:MAG: preprotein translocase subunit YajC [Fibrobacter sp.]|nr:preprotein translocase subunit YajC [Fibrobacter sp.]